VTGCQPNGITVAGSPDFRVTCPIGARVAVRLDGATPWSPRLPSAIEARSRAFAAGARRAREVGAEVAPEAGFGGLLGGRGPRDIFSTAAGRQIAALECALADGDAVAAAGACIPLLGLGIGLTPSGDDLLVGLLAALHARRAAALPLIAAAVATAAPTRTTSLSAAAVVAAAHGRFPERMHDVLVAIAGNDDDAIRSSIERAMQFGASSGADTLVGLFVGLGLGITGRATRVMTAA
jgi:hypothetical protein